MKSEIEDMLSGTNVAVRVHMLADHFKVSEEVFHQILIKASVDRLFAAVDLSKPGSLQELHHHLNRDLVIFQELFQELALLKQQVTDREEELKALTARAKQLLDQTADKLNPSI